MKKKIIYPLLTLMSLSFLTGCNTNGDATSSHSSEGISSSENISSSEKASSENASSSDAASSSEGASSEDASSSDSASTTEEASSSENTSSSDVEQSSSAESSSQNYTYRSEVSKEPTCEEDGVRSFICNEDSTRSYTESIPALGHLYDVTNLEFAWVDYDSASVTTKCTRCDKDATFYASIVSKVITEPTCTKSGEKDYTATVTINGQSYSDIKKETLVDSHSYTKVEEKSIAPTYATEGKLVERCEKCSDEKETALAKQSEELDKYGSETNPYLIASLTDWNAFATDAATNTFKGKYIKIANDIGTAEEPITTLAKTTTDSLFSGTILGNGKTFYVDLSARENGRTALFPLASSATFKDLTISGKVNGAANDIASAFVSDGRGTMAFDNCVNNAAVNAKGSASGFVGFLRGGCMLTITNSKNTGTIYATENYAGGFVSNGGDAKLITLDNCVNEGIISAKAKYLDQFVGKSKDATETDPSNLTVNENCQKNGHAYFRSEQKVDVTGHYYSCIEEGCTEKFGLTNHSMTLVAEVPSTCTKAGTKEHYTCDACDKKFIKVDEEYVIATDDSLTLPLAEHTYKLVDEVASTCQKEGTKAHYVCEQCGQTFLLKDGTYVPAALADLTLDKAEHEYGAEYKSDASGHWQLCTSCGEESEHVAHVKDYDEATEEHGITCTVCGYKIAPAKTHEHAYGDVVPEVKASYATKGTIAYVQCTGCDAKFDPDTHKELSADQMATLSQKDATDSTYGTEENPYLLANSEDFKAFTEDVNSGTTFEGKVVKMAADITEAVTTIIGTSAKPFKGTFDGDNHSVNLNINATAANAGMFGYTSGATIKNVVTKGILETKTDPKVANSAGSLVGLADNTTINGCVNYANITINGGLGDVGGLVGCGNSKTITISDCKNYGSIKAVADCKTAKYVGGIIGDIKAAGAIITNCVSGYETLSEGTEQSVITNMISYAGGIVGGTQVKIAISDCVNYMGISSTVTSNTGFGGIIGLVNSGAKGCSISNSVNHGSLEASSSVGGIIGRLATSDTAAPLTLTNCSNDGNLTIGSVSASEDVGTTAIPGRLIGSSKVANTTYKIINE